MKVLTRRGVLIEEQAQTYMVDNDADSDEARTLRPPQAAACSYRIAFGPRAGSKVLTVQNALPRDADFEQALCADMNGFSLHAAVRCGADETSGTGATLPLHHPTRRRTEERVQCNAGGQVVLKLKTVLARRHLVMSPLEFMQRLAALVSRPLAGRVGPVARLLARHKQSTGPLMGQRGRAHRRLTGRRRPQRPQP